MPHKLHEVHIELTRQFVIHSWGSGKRWADPQQNQGFSFLDAFCPYDMTLIQQGLGANNLSCWPAVVKAYAALLVFLAIQQERRNAMRIAAIHCSLVEA